MSGVSRHSRQHLARQNTSGTTMYDARPPFETMGTCVVSPRAHTCATPSQRLKGRKHYSRDESFWLFLAFQRCSGEPYHLYIEQVNLRPATLSTPSRRPPPPTGAAAGGSGAKNPAPAEDSEQYDVRLRRVQSRQPQHAGAADPAAARLEPFHELSGGI